MTELKVYNLADDRETHKSAGTLLCSINDHNIKLDYVYDILKDTVDFSYVHDHDHDVCKAFIAELTDHVRHHWLSKLNTKKR